MSSVHYHLLPITIIPPDYFTLAWSLLETHVRKKDIMYKSPNI